MKGANNLSVAGRSKLLLLTGFLFFVNPVPLGFDILPDVLGCVLLYFGLSQLAFFDGEIDRARKCVLYLALLEGLHFISMQAFVYTAIGSNRMLAVCGFAIGQGILYFIIIRSLFSGFSYFAMRNNLNGSLKRCDGCRFLSFLAFFGRIAATVLPELMYIIELEGENPESLEQLEQIENIMSAKPMLIILLSLLALVIGIAWYVLTSKFICVFYREGKEILDTRYKAEYTSKSGLVKTKCLSRVSIVLYVALAFSTDIVMDNNHITPVWAMFLLFFVASFFAKGLGGLRLTRYFAIPPAVLFFAANRFADKYVPYGAIAVNETDLWVVCVNFVIAVFAAVFGMLCVRILFRELNGICLNLTGKTVGGGAYFCYCLTVLFWAAGYIVPYFFSYFTTLRILFCILFIWQGAKQIIAINELYSERIALYGE